MTVMTISSREFNQDVSKAKRSTANGPVFITDRGHAAHVLLTINDYQEITDKSDSIVDLLVMPEVVDIEFDPPRLTKNLYSPADLS